MGWWGSGGRVFSPEKSEVSSYPGLLAIYSQREFESDFETALGVEGGVDLSQRYSYFK